MNKNISENWTNIFPELKKYSKNKYYKVLECLLVGIELIKLPRINEYRPFFVIYSLYGNKIGTDLKSCLSAPIIIQELLNKKGLQYSFSEKKFNDNIFEVLKNIKQQFPFSLEGDITLEELYKTIDKHSLSPPLNANSNSFMQASLLEHKLKISLFLRNEKSIDEIFNKIKNNKWDLKHFNLCNIDYREWVNNIESEIINFDVMINRVDNLKKEKKLEGILNSKIII